MGLLDALVMRRDGGGHQFVRISERREGGEKSSPPAPEKNVLRRVERATPETTVAASARREIDDIVVTGLGGVSTGEESNVNEKRGPNVVKRHEVS